MKFGNNLKLNRKHKKMNQSELAQLLGVGRTTITKWETGENIPGIDVLEQLASIFEVSTDDLLGREPLIEKYKRSNDNVRLLSHYSKLNDLGKNEAVKRVAELTELSRYCGNNNNMPIAAHNDAEIDKKELQLMKQDIEEL